MAASNPRQYERNLRNPAPKFRGKIAEPDGQVTRLADAADTAVTIRHMLAIVREYAWQVRDLAPILVGQNIGESSRNVWDFIYNHIQYVEDDANNPNPNSRTEDLRTPGRTWADKAGDCDCMAIFAGAILHEMGLEFAFRRAAYNRRDGYEHVYTIVPDKNQQRIWIIDPVLHQFNREEPYLYKQDTYMEIRRLSQPGQYYTGSAYPNWVGMSPWYRPVNPGQMRGLGDPQMEAAVQEGQDFLKSKTGETGDKFITAAFEIGQAALGAWAAGAKEREIILTVVKTALVVGCTAVGAYFGVPALGAMVGTFLGMIVEFFVNIFSPPPQPPSGWNWKQILQDGSQADKDLVNQWFVFQQEYALYFNMSYMRWLWDEWRAGLSGSKPFVDKGMRDEAQKGSLTFEKFVYYNIAWLCWTDTQFTPLDPVAAAKFEDWKRRKNEWVAVLCWTKFRIDRNTTFPEWNGVNWRTEYIVMAKANNTSYEQEVSRALVQTLWGSPDEAPGTRLEYKKATGTNPNPDPDFKDWAQGLGDWKYVPYYAVYRLPRATPTGFQFNPENADHMAIALFEADKYFKKDANGQFSYTDAQIKTITDQAKAAKISNYQQVINHIGWYFENTAMPDFTAYESKPDFIAWRQGTGRWAGVKRAELVDYDGITLTMRNTDQVDIPATKATPLEITIPIKPGTPTNPIPTGPPPIGSGTPPGQPPKTGSGSGAGSENGLVKFVKENPITSLAAAGMIATSVVVLTKNSKPKPQKGRSRSMNGPKPKQSTRKGKTKARSTPKRSKKTPIVHL